MKRMLMMVSSLAGLVLAAVLISGLQGPAQGAEDSQSRIQQGFAIAPVPLDLRGKNLALVGLGSYIVNAQSVCADCHSCPTYAPGHNPFLGKEGQLNTANYLARGVPFGPFTSRNITPDDQGKPAGFTFDEFLRVLRTGIDLEQEHPQISPLLQVMPWPIFRNMIYRDIRAIYEYLSAIPHAEPGTTCTGPGQ